MADDWNVVTQDNEIDDRDTDPTDLKVTLGKMIRDGSDNFFDFDLTEIQQVLSNLESTDAIDLSHAELLQQQSLRGADILAEYLGKLVRATGVLETKVNSTKNRISLNYKAPDDIRTTAEMKKSAGESAPEVIKLQLALAEAKGSKTLLEKKYDILIKSHHHYKDISAGLRKTILGS